MEPINGSRVDKSGEGTASDSEGFADRGEAKTNVEVLSHLVNEVSEQSVGGVFATIGLGLRSDLVDLLIELILGEEVGNVTGGQDIVNVNEELVLRDLGIGKNKEKWDSLNTSFNVSYLDIVL
jgi:hypothetical protein